MTAKRLWDIFRLTPEEYERVRDFQTKHKVFRLLLGNRNSLDHDHDTGQVFGLLEWRLNYALGFGPMRNPKVLRALADFLENPPVTQVLGKPRYGLIGRAKYKKRMIYGPADSGK